MSKKYSVEFKLAVIRDYYSSSFGVRMIALKYNLPSKNYIEKWEKYLKEKGFLSTDATKAVKSAGRSKETVARQDERTPRKKQYESEIDVLKAKVAYLESLESLQPFLKKSKSTGAKVQSNHGLRV